MKNRKKSFLVLFMCAFLVPVIVFTGIFLYEKEIYKTQLNFHTAALIGSIREKYPDVTDDELLSLLDGGRDEEGREFLQKYGYYGEEFFLSSANGFSGASLVLLIMVSGAVFMFSAAAYLLLEKRRKNEIKELTSYLKEIENGIYSLKINENAEDELSKLSNEIYKITVLLRESAQRSEAQTKALSVYLADISHQIKTPLTSVSIMLDNILETPDMDESTKRDFLSEIRRQTNLISSLCITLLKLSKLASGTVEFTRSKIKAGELINAALQNLAVLLDIKNISVLVSGDLDAQISADKKWQTEAISNIIKNAAEHSSENSKIAINVENSGLFIKIRIKDEGEGIDEKDLPHIFERFYKAKNSSADSFGIGLALAKTVIEKDNGNVYASSKKGEGTVFTVAYRLI